MIKHIALELLHVVVFVLEILEKLNVFWRRQRDSVIEPPVVGFREAIEYIEEDTVVLAEVDGL